MRLSETVLGETAEITSDELLSRNPGAMLEAFLADDNVLEVTMRCRSHAFYPVRYRKLDGLGAMAALALAREE